MNHVSVVHAGSGEKVVVRAKGVVAVVVVRDKRGVAAAAMVVAEVQKH